MRVAAATLGRLPRAAAAAPLAVIRAPRALVPGRHGRRRLIALAVLLAALGAAYMFWLRDSSLVRIEHVTVTGLGRADSTRIHAELAAAAEHMTTLHVNEAELRKAVAGESVVQSISVQTDFPHGLRVTIVQNRPVAVLVAPGREVAVAPDGTLLEGAKLSAGLPIVHVAALPSRRLPDGPTRQRVFVAAAAPVGLLSRVDSISVEHGRGVVAQLSHGPAIIFGQANDLDAKWAAAAAVLAQRSSAGATYIDVRMPDRPVAGGLGMKDPPQAQPQGTATGSPGVVPAVPPAPAGGATAATGSPTQVAPSPAPTSASPTGAAAATQTGAPQSSSAQPTAQSQTATPQTQSTSPQPAP